MESKSVTNTPFQLKAHYLRYLGYCNERRFDRLTELAAETLACNGTLMSQADYVQAISSGIVATPNSYWKVQDIVVQGQVVAVRLSDIGTPISDWLGFMPTGQAFDVQEMAFYHFGSSGRKAR